MPYFRSQIHVASSFSNSMRLLYRLVSDSLKFSDLKRMCSDYEVEFCGTRDNLKYTAVPITCKT